MRTIGIDLSSDDIEISHCLNGKNSKPIIVKFLSYKDKSRIYKARTKLKNIKVSEIFPEVAPVSPNQEKIFLNENLTAYRQKMMRKAAKKKRDRNIQKVWSIDGKIFIKRSPISDPNRVSSVEGILKL